MSQASVRIIDQYFDRRESTYVDGRIVSSSDYDGSQSAARHNFARTFESNPLWTANLSTRKRISIRKFNVYPETNYFDVKFEVHHGGEVLEFWASSIWDPYMNTMDLISDVRRKFNDWYKDTLKPAVIPPDERFIDLRMDGTRMFAVTAVEIVIRFTVDSQRLLNQVPYMITNPDYDPDKEEGPGNRKLIYAADPNNPVKGHDVDPESGTITFAMGYETGTYDYADLFGNVWDRQRLYMHGSFSQARNHFVCEAGETFWVMNKDFNYNSTRFDVWFSLDGRTPFILHNDNYMFELGFTAEEDDRDRRNLS